MLCIMWINYVMAKPGSKLFVGRALDLKGRRYSQGLSPCAKCYALEERMYSTTDGVSII